jgi:hypothetical protein
MSQNEARSMHSFSLAELAIFAKLVLHSKGVLNIGPTLEWAIQALLQRE